MMTRLPAPLFATSLALLTTALYPALAALTTAALLVAGAVGVARGLRP